MGFKDLMGKAQDMGMKDIVDKAESMTGAAADAAGKYLDEFNEALPVMRALGFTLRNFRMGMGLIPEVSVELIASLDTVNPGKLDELIKSHPEEKMLAALLKALQAAYHIKEQLGEKAFRSIEMDITLGLPPHIGVKFGDTVPAK